MSGRQISPEQLKLLKKRENHIILELLALADAQGKIMVIAEFSSDGKMGSGWASLAAPGVLAAMRTNGVQSKLEAAAASGTAFYPGMQAGMMPNSQKLKNYRDLVISVKARRGYGGPKVTRGSSVKSIAVVDMKEEECRGLLEQYYRAENVRMPAGVAESIAQSIGEPFDGAEMGKRRFCAKDVFKSSGLQSIMENKEYNSATDGRSNLNPAQRQAKSTRMTTMNLERKMKRSLEAPGTNGGTTNGGGVQDIEGAVGEDRNGDALGGGDGEEDDVGEKGELMTLPIGQDTHGDGLDGNGEEELNRHASSSSSSSSSNNSSNSNTHNRYDTRGGGERKRSSSSSNADDDAVGDDVSLDSEQLLAFHSKNNKGPRGGQKSKNNRRLKK